MTRTNTNSELDLNSEQEWKENLPPIKIYNIVRILLIVFIVGVIAFLILEWDTYYKTNLLSFFYILILLTITVIRAIQVFIARLLLILKGNYVIYKNKKFPIVNGLLTIHPKEKISSLQEIEGLDFHKDSISGLDLSYNNLGTLEGIDIFPHIEILALNNNLIDTLAKIPELPSLKILSMAHNQIRQMDPTKTFPNVELLDLSENYIREINGLEHFPNLKGLVLSRNFIQNLHGLEASPNLKAVKLSQNQLISTIGIEKSPNINSIYLSHNKITQITGLERHFNLKIFEYQHNLLPKGIHRPRSIRGQSWVKYCQLASGPRILHDLQEYKDELQAKIVGSNQQPGATQSLIHEEFLQNITKIHEIQKKIKMVEKRIAWLARMLNKPDYNQEIYRIPQKNRPLFDLKVIFRGFGSRVVQNLRKSPIYKVIFGAFIFVANLLWFYIISFMNNLNYPERYQGALPYFFMASLVFILLLWLLQHQKKK